MFKVEESDRERERLSVRDTTHVDGNINIHMVSAALHPNFYPTTQHGGRSSCCTASIRRLMQPTTVRTCGSHGTPPSTNLDISVGVSYRKSSVADIQASSLMDHVQLQRCSQSHPILTPSRPLLHGFVGTVASKHRSDQMTILC